MKLAVFLIWFYVAIAFIMSIFIAPFIKEYSPEVHIKSWKWFFEWTKDLIK